MTILPCPNFVAGGKNKGYLQSMEQQSLFSSKTKTDFATRMHSSRMRTAHSSSRPGRSPPGHCYGLLVWWPSVIAFWPLPEDHTRRPPSIRRPPYQKGTTEDHTPGADPPGADLLGTRHPPGTRYPPGDLLQGMLG